LIEYEFDLQQTSKAQFYCESTDDLTIEKAPATMYDNTTRNESWPHVMHLSNAFFFFTLQNKSLVKVACKHILNPTPTTQKKKEKRKNTDSLSFWYKFPCNFSVSNTISLPQFGQEK
jgi:hypothetical protein